MKIPKSLRAIILNCQIIAATIGFPSISNAGFIVFRDGREVISFNNEPEFVNAYLYAFAKPSQIIKEHTQGKGILYFIFGSTCSYMKTFLQHPERLALIINDETHAYHSLEDALSSEEFRRIPFNPGEFPYVLSFDLKKLDITAAYDEFGTQIIDARGHGVYRNLKTDTSCP